jgi:sporulation protein YlmC with PRC-barrel domain
MGDLDLVYRVLDLQVVDVEGRRCGKVDDIELGGEPTRAVAILVGHGTYPDRLPGRRLPRLARRLIGPAVLGRNVIRVPWEDIDEIESAVHVRRPAAELALDRGDRVLERMLERGRHR